MWLVRSIPPKKSAYPGKTKGTFSWNSAYHQSCKNYELLVDSSDFGIYGCEQKMYYWWKSGHHSDFGHHSDSRNPCKILRKIFLCPRHTQTQHSQHLLRAGYKEKGPWFWMKIRKKFRPASLFSWEEPPGPMTVIQVDAMARKPSTLSMSLTQKTLSFYTPEV